MKRRNFIASSLAGGTVIGNSTDTVKAQTISSVPPKSSYLRKGLEFADNLYLEKEAVGTPHKGKVFAAIQAHADDIPYMWAGTVAKLIKEGYTGYLIRTTNDEEDNANLADIEKDHYDLAKVLGIKKVFDLGYRKHRIDNVAIVELRERLFFLIRVLQIDTILSFDPYDHYEENPDHYYTAQAVLAARWMSNQRMDYPEHFKGGIKPKSVRELYMFGRGSQLINRVIDISSVIDKKVESNVANKAWGIAPNRGVQLREQLAKENMKLPILGNDDYTSNFQYYKQFYMEDEKKVGEMFGFEYAEACHYIGPGYNIDYKWDTKNRDEYIKNNVVPLR
ncbi:PIG-L deacetylase family protein [Candidatus Latescibacterota bacterium]